MEFDRKKLALIAFIAHAPGVWLFGHAKLKPAVLRLNLIVGGLTVVAVIAAALLWSDSRLLAAVVAFIIGHLTWSTILSRLILKGEALASPGERTR